MKCRVPYRKYLTGAMTVAALIVYLPAVKAQPTPQQQAQIASGIDEAIKALGPEPRLKKLSSQARRQLVEFVLGNTLFVMAAGAGFFLAMYEWLTMIAEAMPSRYTSWYSSIASSSFNVSGSTISLASSASLDTFVHSSNSMFWMMYGGATASHFPNMDSISLANRVTACVTAASASSNCRSILSLM